MKIPLGKERLSDIRLHYVDRIVEREPAAGCGDEVGFYLIYCNSLVDVGPGSHND